MNNHPTTKLIDCFVCGGSNPWDFRKIESNVWELLSDVTYGLKFKTKEESFILTLTVPQGFRYDLASIPKVFQGLLGNKETIAIEACLLHDYIYEFNNKEGTLKGKNPLLSNRLVADKAFLRLMELYDNPREAWKRLVMYQAVRMFGGKPFASNSGRNKTSLP